MRTGAANDLKTVGGCLKDLDHLSLFFLTSVTFSFMIVFYRRYTFEETPLFDSVTDTVIASFVCNARRGSAFILQ